MGYLILILEKHQELNRIISPHNEYALCQTGLTGIEEGGKGVGDLMSYRGLNLIWLMNLPN